MVWSHLKDKLRAMDAAHLVPMIRPPAEAESLDELARELGVPLPPSLRAAWLEHDGAPELVRMPVLFDHRWATMVHREVREWCRLEEVNADYHSWVPFAWYEEPPYVCVDGSAAGRGRILELDEGEVREVAKDLDAWFVRLARDLDRGRCVSRRGLHFEIRPRVAARRKIPTE